MSMERQFLLTPSEVQLLDSVISQEVIHAFCAGPSFQTAVYEPGVLCQAVVLRTQQGGVAIRPVCEDFTDIEVFRLSALTENDPNFAKGFAKLPMFRLKHDVLGTLFGWKAVASRTEFERKCGEPFLARAEVGLLLQFEGQRRLLIMVSGLPFFIHCFTDPSEIDAELAAITAG